MQTSEQILSASAPSSHLAQDRVPARHSQYADVWFNRVIMSLAMCIFMCTAKDLFLFCSSLFFCGGNRHDERHLCGGPRHRSVDRSSYALC